MNVNIVHIHADRLAVRTTRRALVSRTVVLRALVDVNVDAARTLRGRARLSRRNNDHVRLTRRAVVFVPRIHNDVLRLLDGHGLLTPANQKQSSQNGKCTHSLPPVKYLPDSRRNLRDKGLAIRTNYGKILREEPCEKSQV